MLSCSWVGCGDGPGQGVQHSKIQEAENYAEDAITVQADKFGQPAGDDPPAVISSDQLKALFPELKS